MSVSFLLYLIALVCFVFATFGTPTGRVGLVPLGLALSLLAFLIGNGSVHG